jgi:hypothetical protein
VLLALGGGEGRRQHDAGVVDEDVGTAEFLLHALGGGDDRVAVRDVSLDGDRAVAELVGKGVDAVGAAASSATRWPSAATARAVASPMPDEAPVMTATRPVL